jgi:hypothetical protein
LNVRTNGIGGNSFNNSPGNVAIVKTSKTGTKLADSAVTIDHRRNASDVNGVHSPRATDGHNTHNSARSMTTARRCHQAITSSW